MKVMGFLRRLIGGPTTGSSSIPSTTRVTSPMQPKDRLESEPFLILLSKFLQPRAADFIPEWWSKQLGMPVEDAFKVLAKEGHLREGSLVETVAHNHSGADLKKLCKGMGLKVSGTKAEQAQRLVDADERMMREKVAGKAVMACTEEARRRVEQYLASKEEERLAAMLACKSALEKKDLALAIRSAGEYDARQVKLRGGALVMSLDGTTRQEEAPGSQFDPKEMMIELRRIFSLSPNILAELSARDLQYVRIHEALSLLLPGGVPKSFQPADFAGVSKFNHDVTFRMMHFHRNHIRQINRMQEAGIKTVEIRGVGKQACPCEMCAAFDGVEFPIAKVPELPLPDCQCHMGCRCRLAPKDLGF